MTASWAPVKPAYLKASRRYKLSKFELPLISRMSEYGTERGVETMAEVVKGIMAEGGKEEFLRVLSINW